uniref:Uncharacterized protein n=1 Tax=Mustela putorius furo TaxID=9669 RepID=M3YCL5_MUSPF
RAPRPAEGSGSCSSASSSAGETWPGGLLDTFVAWPGLPPRRAGGRACCRGGLNAGPSKSEWPEAGRREGPGVAPGCPVRFARARSGASECTRAVDTLGPSRFRCSLLPRHSSPAWAGGGSSHGAWGRGDK